MKKKKTLVLSILVVLTLTGLSFFYFYYSAQLKLIEGFVEDNIKDEYKPPKIGLKFEILEENDFENYYSYEWVKNNINFQIILKPNEEVSTLITYNEILDVDKKFSQSVVNRYFNVPENTDFICEYPVKENFCRADWDDKIVVVGCQDQTVIIYLGKILR